MDLLKAYSAANDILETIDFNTLFAGFRKYRFALYSSIEICFDGKIMPYQDGFRGNTSILHEGEYIAIWNMKLDRIDDPEQLAGCLVHEMFHCHQRTNSETRYPSDFELLNYPGDAENFLKKYNENRYLADAYEQRDIMQLRKFACIRDSRLRMYPSVVRQELKAETLEGMAEYAGLKALKHINADKFDAAVNEYLGKLRAEDDLLFDVRRISYYSGAIYFLCLEMFGFSINNDFGSEQTAYEQNPIELYAAEADVLSYEFVARSFTQLMDKRKNEIAEHLSRSRFIECKALICGYDPMNMFRIGDFIYCRYFVCLDEGGRLRSINSAAVLKLADGSNQEVIGYFLAD